MAAKVKCPSCGILNEKEDTVTIGKRYYCSDCAESKIENKDSYQRLIEYICKLYKMKKPTGMIFKQIKEFKNDYQFTDDGVYMTLKYYYETLENKPLDGVGIGIVPYYYDRAKEYYMLSLKVEDSLDKYKTVETNTIKVDIEKREKLFSSCNKKTLTFDDIEWSENIDE